MSAASVSRDPSSRTTLPDIKALCPKDASGPFMVGCMGTELLVLVLVVVVVVVVVPAVPWPEDLLPWAEAKRVKVRVRNMQQVKR